ncbi:heme o synthase [Marinitenerispora sediminis]|uniref:Protoheme IX farnesyltransferase n=1 Tax=Marinitenerispora sediminis TaxID=1931232 RepID=A0A368TA92_9ACTN|nr:heme o synthase [Marinitenerispora sediminis]RCV49927.1 protoheme IX farnesyltransferase [Marinitenerispora sediminis]RCV53952.1 protoheme IX farnesyltransferase [Marinitenerispora sediminis]RCV61437.1 protoheme IX farnesyltransferase [Marinitenerispora sediminis]
MTLLNRSPHSAQAGSAESRDEPAAGPPTFGGYVRAYIALSKPRVIELLLITTIPVMFVAAGGVPPLGTAVATLVFGAMSAASANALNCYFDRDIDQEMRRTRRRPAAMQLVTPRGAVLYGLALGVVSTVGFAALVNWLSAALSLFAILFYLLVYTLLLKRRTAQNVVWGGIAGCMPVLIGWSGITNSLDWAPFVLFLVVFFWTPPHTWALAMRYREDYAAANVPMLPVVAGDRRVVLECVLYSWATVLVSLALWPVAGTTLFYPLAALVLGGILLVQAHRLLNRVRAGVTGAQLKTMGFFHLSNAYLALLFSAVTIDPLLANLLA